MGRRQRRQWQHIVRQLELPVPFSLDVFCAQIGRTTGRALVLVPRDSRVHGPAPCGLLVRTEAIDHLFYESATSELHRRQNVFHEIGHLLADHTPVPELPAAAVWVQMLLPDLDPAMIQAVLTRGGYQHAMEREAETIASLLGLRVDAVVGRPPDADPSLRRMAVIFGHDVA